MKKLIIYIVVCGWLFAGLDFSVISITRLDAPSWKDWMHAHERQYQVVTTVAEVAVCAPAVALKPVFLDAFMRVSLSTEEQGWIVHAPFMDWKGFYHLPDRRYSWTFVPWTAWILYWTPISILWWKLTKRTPA